MIPDLRIRATEPERMDLPDCDERRLLRTLDQFPSINRWFSRVRSLLRRQVLARLTPGVEAHLLDLGAGGCDIPVWLLREARRRGLSLRVTAVDADPRVVRHARTRHGNEPGLTIVEGDALDPAAHAPFDYVFANHLLHHLPGESLPPFFAEAVRLAPRGVVFSDLRRSHFSLVGFSLLARVYRDSYTREDGLLSIRKAFTPAELRSLIGPLPLRVDTAFPGRVWVVSD